MFGDYKFRSPVVPANMKTVINAELAQELALRGYFYVMHRFGVDSFEFVKSCYDKALISSISVGVNGVDRELIERLAMQNLQPNYITIDIAHGYSEHMVEMIQWIKDRLQNTFVIAGNVCDASAVSYLYKKGADAVKVGVGPGHACTTRQQTGFFRPQFSAVLECCDTRWVPVGVPIIADGGIEYNGDIAKALVAGAHMVMCGQLLAGHDESPGERIQQADGLWVKEYYGSASEHNKAHKRHIEGRRTYLPVRGSLWNKYQQIEDNLRSSCSYAGAENPRGLTAASWKVIK
jgi:GMP reductase